MTRALYEVTSQDGCMLTVTDDDEQPVAVVEVKYYGSYPPSVDGVAVRRVYWPDGKTKIRPSEDYPLWEVAFDAATAYLESPACDWDAIGEALGLTFVNAYARDNGR